MPGLQEVFRQIGSSGLALETTPTVNGLHRLGFVLLLVLVLVFVVVVALVHSAPLRLRLRVRDASHYAAGVLWFPLLSGVLRAPFLRVSGHGHLEKRSALSINIVGKIVDILKKDDISLVTIKYHKMKLYADMCINISHGTAIFAYVIDRQFVILTRCNIL